jgi:hypothetical protein
MPAPTLADAALDRRVARADARDRYDAAVERARQQLARDYFRADTVWILAANRARTAAVQRRAIRARYRDMSTVFLAEERSRLAYMLTPGYAVYTNPAEKATVTVLVGMIDVVLRQRGVDVS